MTREGAYNIWFFFCRGEQQRKPAGVCIYMHKGQIERHMHAYASPASNQLASAMILHERKSA
jgi:hypothetical protein